MNLKHASILVIDDDQDATAVNFIKNRGRSSGYGKNPENLRWLLSNNLSI